MRHLSILLSLIILLVVRANGYPQPEFLRSHDMGIIFNTDSLLLDYESYRGGLGVKLTGEEFAYRTLVDLYFSTISRSRALELGLAAEYHPAEARVSPYFGAYLQGGWAAARDQGGGESWTDTRVAELGVGTLLGAEIYVTRFLSLFTEYDLGLTYSSSKTEETVNGETSTTRERDWTFDIRPGNQSKIGVVLYISQGRDFDLQRNEDTNHTEGK